jgi:hypothetical protein
VIWVTDKRNFLGMDCVSTSMSSRATRGCLGRFQPVAAAPTDARDQPNRSLSIEGSAMRSRSAALWYVQRFPVLWEDFL